MDGSGDDTVGMGHWYRKKRKRDTNIMKTDTNKMKRDTNIMKRDTNKQKFFHRVQNQGTEIMSKILVQMQLCPSKVTASGVEKPWVNEWVQSYEEKPEQINGYNPMKKNPEQINGYNPMKKNPEQINGYNSV